MGPDALRSEVINVEDTVKNVDMNADSKYEEDSSDCVFIANSKSPSKTISSETEKHADGSCQNGNESELSAASVDTSPPSSPISKPSVERCQNSNSVPAKYCNTDVSRLFPDYYVGKIVRFPRSFDLDESSTLPENCRDGVEDRKLPEKYSSTDVPELFSYIHVDKISRLPKSSDTGELSTPSKIHCNGEQNKKLNQVDQSSVEEVSKNTGPGSEHATLSLPPAASVPYKGNFSKPAKNTKRKKDYIGANPGAADWRFGPAKLWYDMLDVPENGEGFDYGFKLKKTDDNHTAKEAIHSSDFNIPDETFLMVVQITWEDDVIWEVDERVKQKVWRNLNRQAHAAGWLPYNNYRAAPFLGHSRSHSYVSSENGTANNADNNWYSIFPIENEELIHGIWEDEIIWDSEAVSQIPYPKLPTLDLNDDNILFEVPGNTDPRKQESASNATSKPKVSPRKAKVTDKFDEDVPSQSPNLDAFNVSNDSYYLPKLSDTSLKLKMGGNLIQHSIPVIELQAPFVQTQIGPTRLRNFHRPLLKRYADGSMAHPGPHCVTSLTEYIKEMAEEREKLRVATGGGSVFFMRAAKDLTGRDGELILVEFSEEHPPLINQVGMCSKITNYYKRKATKDQNPTKFRYGELAYAHTSPFLGTLRPGKSIQAIENNMYRAPIYEHRIPQTDFLVIRTRHQYFIREIDALFTAGQLCPLYEVPSPRSKIAIDFVRDFFLVFIYRLFWCCEDLPRRIKFEDVMKAFPSHPKETIRKRLKICSDLKMLDNSWWWVLKPDFILPSEDQMRSMVSPEQYCAYFSAIAAEQRLYDAGYGEKSLFAPIDDDPDMLQKLDDEVKAAPWNTTRAYIQAMKGKCMLQLNGPGDPTGCDEGFSYIQVPIRPTSKENDEEQATQSKKILDELGADLNNLSLNAGKMFLKKYGIPEKIIKKLNQWEIIETVRALSMKKAKVDGKRLAKFSKKNRFSAAERQKRYEKECQRIFNLQNKILSSKEILSSDEGESADDDDSDIEEMSRHIELMLTSKKTSKQLLLEREEQQRKELRKIVRDGNLKKSDKDLKKERVLKIYRTYRDPDGNEFTRTELVRNQGVIEAYVKVRTTKTEEFIKQFAVPDVSERKEMELRRKRNRSLTIEPSQDPSKNAETPTKMVPCSGTVSKQKPCPVQGSINVNINSKLRCGACGAIGHMRSNRSCPKYQLNIPPRPLAPPPQPMSNIPPIPKLVQEVLKQTNNKIENSVSVEGTKLTISNQLIKFHEVIKRQSEALLKNAIIRKRQGSSDDLENEKKRFKPTDRYRTDPRALLINNFEAILNEIRNMPDAQHFMFPVSAKRILNDDRIIHRPMDLQTMSEKIKQKKYKNRGDFLTDLNQIVQNSSLYNGAMSSLTLAARDMLNLCLKRLKEKEDQLVKLEKEIKLPSSNNDYQRHVSYVLENIVNNLTRMPESSPFLKPIDKKSSRVCYGVIARPMDLETISKKVKAHQYHSKNEFLGDIELIYNNCVIYYGRKSLETEKAIILMKAAKILLEELNTRAHSSNLEPQIKKIPEVKIDPVSSSCNTKNEHQCQKSQSSLSINVVANIKSAENLEKQVGSKNAVEDKTSETSEDSSSSSSSSPSSENDESDDDAEEEVKGEDGHVLAIDQGQTQISTSEDVIQPDSLNVPKTDAGNIVDTETVGKETFPSNFHSLNDEMRDKNHQDHKLTTNVSVKLNVLLDDLNISDEEAETNGKHENIPATVVKSNVENGNDNFNE